MRRKAAADRADKVANARPTSTRAAGAGGSSGTMLSELVSSMLGFFFCERGGGFISGRRGRSGMEKWREEFT